MSEALRLAPRWLIGAGLSIAVYSLILIVAVTLLPDLPVTLNQLAFGSDHPADRCDLLGSLSGAEATLLAPVMSVLLPGHFVGRRIFVSAEQGTVFSGIVLILSALPIVVLGAILMSERIGRSISVTIALAYAILATLVFLFYRFGIGMSCFVT